MAKARRKVFEASKEDRAIARERVGAVKPGHAIVPKYQRQPKHKTNLLRDPAAADQ